MEKRLFLAIALSLLVLLTWSAFVNKTYHIDNQRVTTKDTSFINPAAKSISLPPPQQESLLPSFNYLQEKFNLTFVESKAAIQEVLFKAYQDYRFPLKSGFFLDNQPLLFKKESSAVNEIVFAHIDVNKKITKRFIFSNYNYGIELEIGVQNLSSGPMTFNLPLVLGVLDFSAQNPQARFQDVAVATKEKTLHLSARKEATFQEIKFISLRDRYFCSIIQPAALNYTGFIKKINPQEFEIGLASSEFTLAPGQRITEKFSIYLGPQELQLINPINPHWSAILHYGTFDVISQFLLQLLRFLYGVVHNWGWAIVILSFVVYIVLYPLSLKQMRSMKEMQALQPKIEELRKAHKDNPQKLNKEIMELYREHKVNPLGGCLPLILQIPIFFALYQVLMRSVFLKGAKFLWIKDLSGPDRLFILPASLPILGNEINILPIIMAIGMFIQQKISMTTSSSGTAEQQKLMMILFPLMFGFIFYHMPSGLVLYWLINSTLMLLYQLRVTRKK